MSRSRMSDWRPRGFRTGPVHWWHENTPLGPLTCVFGVIFLLGTIAIIGVRQSGFDDDNAIALERYHTELASYEAAREQHDKTVAAHDAKWREMREEPIEPLVGVEQLLRRHARALANAEASGEDELVLLADIQRQLGAPYDAVDASEFVSIVNGSQDWPRPAFAGSPPEYPALMHIDDSLTGLAIVAAWFLVFFVMVLISASHDALWIFNAANVRASTMWIGLMVHPWLLVPWTWTAVGNALEYVAEHHRRFVKAREEYEKLARLEPDLRATYRQSQVVRDVVRRELNGLRGLKRVDKAEIDRLEARLADVDAAFAKVFEEQDLRDEAADREKANEALRRIEGSLAELRAMMEHGNELTKDRREMAGIVDGADRPNGSGVG